MRRQHLLELQIPLKKANNPFLKYDSFANCSTTIPLKSELLSSWLAGNSCKVIGTVYREDLNLIISAIKNSGLLTDEDIELYFS